MRKLLLLIGLTLSLSSGCQNFFWSHNSKVGGYGLLYNWPVVKDQYTVQYGYLYNWWAAIGCTDGDNTAETSIASSGWHIPSDSEWATLRTYLVNNGYGYGGFATRIAKSVSYTSGWTVNNVPGTPGNDQSTNNSSGLSLLPAGRRYNTGEYLAENGYAIFWTSTPYSTTVAYYRFIHSHEYDFGSYANYLRASGLSLRLVCNSSTDPGIYIGNDGKEYTTVKIGNQVWLAKNLMETKYADGSLIPTGGSNPSFYTNAEWTALTTGARCVYAETESKAGAIVGNIAMSGWHVPSKAEFETLLNEIDTYNVENDNWPLAGGYLKKIGLAHWNSPNEGADNSSGFTAVGGGSRDGTDGAFGGLKEWNGYVATDNDDPTQCWFLGLNYDIESASISLSLKTDGLSISLIKDDSTDPGTVTDIDGNVYLTIKIGDQVWMAENLKVTHYSNGNDIPEVTDPDAWALLVTGAWCYYNNDPKNK